MKKGTKVRIVAEQEARENWMVLNNFYWGYKKSEDADFVLATLKVGEVLEVVKARGVKGPKTGYIEVKNEKEEVFLVLKNDVIEVDNDER